MNFISCFVRDKHRRCYGVLNVNIFNNNKHLFHSSWLDRWATKATLLTNSKSSYYRINRTLSKQKFENLLRRKFENLNVGGISYVNLGLESLFNYMYDNFLYTIS